MKRKKEKIQKQEKPIVLEKKINPLYVLLFFLFLGLLVYYPVFFHELTNYDDDVNIYKNPLFPLSFDSFAKIWTDIYMGLYIPLTYTIWGFIHLFSQNNEGLLNPFLLHLCNFIFHIASAFMLYLLIKDLLCLYNEKEKKWDLFQMSLVSFLASCFFLLHPLHAEVVSWVTGFKDILSGFLCLCVAYFYTQYLKRDKKKFYFLSLFFILLGILSKPSSITVLGLLFLIERGLFYQKRNLFKSSLQLLPFFMITLPPVIWAKVSQDNEAILSLDFFSRILVCFHAMGFYIYKLILPFNLIPAYGFDPNTVINLGLYIPFSALLLLVFFFLTSPKFREQYNAALFGILAFYMALFPYLGLIPFDGQNQSTVNDRYTYFALTGISFSLAILLLNLKIERKVLISTASCLFLFLGLISAKQTRYWENTQTLFTHTLSVDPSNKQSHFNLATDADARKDFKMAKIYYEKALELVPGEAFASRRLQELKLKSGSLSSNEEVENLLSQGVSFATRGDMDRAIEIFEDVLRKDKENYSSLVNLGNVYAMKNDFNMAISYFERASLKDPQALAAHLNLGRAYKILGNKEKSLNSFKKVLDLDAQNEEAQKNLKELAFLSENSNE